MKTLHIIVSPRKDRSRSRYLGEFLASKLGGEVTLLELNESEVPYILNDIIVYNYGFKNYEYLNSEDKKTADLQNKYINQIRSVDNVIISTPLWNFGIPAILKGYIDIIIKSGETFKSGGNGIEGLLNNIKTLYIVETKLLIYKGTPMENMEDLAKGIKEAFKFIGVTNTKTFTLEGTNLKDENILNNDIEKLKEEIGKSI